MSQITELVAELKVDRDQLDKAIAALSKLYPKREYPKLKLTPKQTTKVLAIGAVRRQMSPAAKARIAAAQRKRWAKFRKEKKSA